MSCACDTLLLRFNTQNQNQKQGNLNAKVVKQLEDHLYNYQQIVTILKAIIN